MQGSQKKYQTDWDAIAELDLLSNTQQKTSAQQQRNSTPALPAQNQLFYQQPSVFGNLPGSAGGPSTNPFVSPQPTSYGAAHFSSGLPSATNTSFNDSSSTFNTASSIQGFSGLGNACGPPLSATNGVFGVPSASLKKPDSWSSSLQNQPWASPQPQTGWGITTQIGQSRNIMDDFGDFATPVVPVAVPVAVPKDDFGDFFSSTSTAATPSPSSVQPQSFAPVSSNDQFNAFSDLSSLSSSSFTSTALRPQLQQQPSYNPNTDLAGKRMSWTSSVPSHTVANGSSWAPSSIPMASPTPDSKRTSLVYGMAPTGSSPTHTSPRMASVTPVFPLARTRSASVLSNESTSSFGSTGRQDKRSPNPPAYDTPVQSASPALSTRSATSMTSASKKSVNWDDFAGIFSGSSEQVSPSQPSTFTSSPAVLPAQVQPQPSFNPALAWSSQTQNQQLRTTSPSQQPFVSPASAFAPQPASYSGLVPTPAIATPPPHHAQSAIFAAQQASSAASVLVDTAISWAPVTPPTASGMSGGMGQADLLSGLDFGGIGVGHIKIVDDEFGSFASTAGDNSDEFGEFGDFETSTNALASAITTPSAFAFLPQLPPTNITASSPTSPTFRRTFSSPTPTLLAPSSQSSQQSPALVFPTAPTSSSPPPPVIPASSLSSSIRPAAPTQKPVDQQEALRRAFEASALYKASVKRDGTGGVGEMDVFSVLTDGKPTSVSATSVTPSSPPSSSQGNKNAVDNMHKVLSKLIAAEYLEEAVACSKHIKALESNMSSPLDLQPLHVQAIWRQLPAAPRPAERPTMKTMVEGIRGINADKAEIFITKFNTNLMFLAQSHLDEAIKVQREATAWFNALTSGKFLNHARDWTRCLEGTLDEFNTALGFLRALMAELAKSPEVEREKERERVLESDKVKTYIAGVIEMHLIVMRIKWAVEHSTDFLSREEERALQRLAGRCEEAWRGVVDGLGVVRAKYMVPKEEFPTEDSGGSFTGQSKEMSGCSVCLVPLGSLGVEKLGWSGRVYHGPCINFWVNRVGGDVR